MFKLNNQKLINLIRYTPVVVVCLFIAITHIVLIQDNRDKAAFTLKTLKESLLTQQQDIIREQVYQVSKQLRIIRSKTDNHFNEEVRKQVNNVYHFIRNLYAQHAEKPEAEIKKIILNALNPLFFFHSQEQLFILDQQGNNLIKSNLPSASSDRWLKAHQVSLPDTVSQSLEKPQEHLWQNTDKTVTYTMDFPAFHWTLGITKYKTNAFEQMKSEMLEWFSNYEYGEGGYFFVLSQSGTLLAHHYNDFFGLDLKVGNHIGQTLLSGILKQTSHGGGYVRYQKPLTISGKTTLEQIIYVKEVKGWDWIIGTGFYSKRFENDLSEKEAQLIRYNHQGLLKLSLIAIISTILLILLSAYVSHLIARRFNQFQQRIIDDVNHLEQTKNQMEYMAHHDALTGLPNRILMIKKINQSIRLARKHHRHVAVMFVDLDNFKNVNDLYGHTLGDQLLKVLGHKFKAIMDEKGFVSRFGGDEFIFCFPDLNNKTEAKAKIKIIRQTLETPVNIEGKTLSVGCSIGITMYPSDSADAETLISKADAALYKSKSHKKGEASFYDQSISEQIQFDLTIENDLQHALKKQQVYILYQPQINTTTGQIVGVEALARWNHETLGPVPPAKFIATAEKTGLIYELGLFVFKQACQDLCHLSIQDEAIKLSVNISPKQLINPKLPNHLLTICSETAMAPQRIILEITENVLIDRLDEVMPQLGQLRELGFGISLDDFGTGYSSLNYLHHLPLTEIKIDRSFIHNLLESSQSEMLVKMIIRIGKFCNMSVVAEGVETEAQFNKLAAHHCDLVQGFYFSPAIDIDQLLIQYDISPDTQLG
ncbi:Phytochrome-like protein cph2 [Vibrio aerogenes CECT 7868]|uniref:Phytochrome-like protein cph2 n=1 Tax=Vibrio aerogenes CECT 7868 TaxID=1216006 RepID=A0A1M6CIT1_9VIBR|nr:EAL domain-containing protein [Vibrio aerogenes]SHI60771.1 Phytochrome-like protein cph2 [Vibrio aerogenes CECT 7868]